MHIRSQALPIGARKVYSSKIPVFVCGQKIVSVAGCPITGPTNHYRPYSRVSWFNPLSKFNNLKNVANKGSYMVIEEPNEKKEELGVEDQYFREFKHYMKTTEMPINLRRRILSDKFSEFVTEVTDFNKNPMTIPILNSVFLNLYNLNGRQLTDLKTGQAMGVLNDNDLITLFEKSSSAITSENTSNLILPEFMAILAKHFLQLQSDIIPMRLLVLVVDLGSSVRYSNLRNTLDLLIKSQSSKLNPEFTLHLLKYYDNKGQLTMSVFEDILFVTKKYPETNIIDDYFYNRYMEYVELLYKDVQPKVHELKNLERDIDRVQIITCTKVIDEADLGKLSMGVLLKLLHLVSELETVNRRPESKASIEKILDYIGNKHGEKLNNSLQSIKEEIFKQNLDDESLLETLLALTWSNSKYKSIAQLLTDYVMKDSIKFSEILRFQTSIYDLIGNSIGALSESGLADAIIMKVEEIVEYKSVNGDHEDTIDLSELYTRIIQALLSQDKIMPRGELTQAITAYFVRTHGVEPSVYSFKLLLDKSIDLQDHIKAVNIFEDSLESYTQWPCNSDPTIHRSLNDLIVLICSEMDDVDLIFPIFTKIKQQMVNTQCKVEAIKAMAKKMLKAEYVGDLIEMLKRELPKIEKDDTIKLPIDGEYGAKYRELFDILYKFVITYNNEGTHETNWVLYGELHKYFHVPFDSYLPAMKYFCEKDRLNAALIIFRQLKRLSELHGNHKHLPPLRDMYMYLFQTFGEKLYEEGVEEIHEYLKMDINLPKQDIALQNAVLNAYSNLQEVGKAKDLFISMSTVPKLVGGINEETIQIMIKTYTYSDMIYVQKFWNNLSQYGIIPNYPIYRQYLIAHVYHGLVEDAMQLTEEMADYDLEVTADTLISMHNYCLDAADQTKIADWARKNHKETWNDVVCSGSLKGAEEYMPENNLIVGSNADN